MESLKSFIPLGGEGGIYQVYCGKKGKGKQYYLPYKIKVVGKNITTILGKKIKVLQNGDGEEYQVVGNFIHP